MIAYYRLNAPSNKLRLNSKDNIMLKIIAVFVALTVLTGNTGLVVSFFIEDPLRILIVFVGLFLLVPMAKLVFGK
jgi:hypothetical protein